MQAVPGLEPPDAHFGKGFGSRLARRRGQNRAIVRQRQGCDGFHVTLEQHLLLALQVLHHHQVLAAHAHQV
jgi:hypothetical protein